MKKPTNDIVVKELKELITKKTETLASTYCAYRANLKSCVECPNLFLDEDITKRTSVLAKELIALTHEIEMLLSIYLNADIRIVELNCLLNYAKTKEIKCCFWRMDTNHIYPIYFIYNTQTHKYKSKGEEK